MADPFKVYASPPTEVLLNPIAWLLWLLDVVVWLVTVVLPIKWLVSCIPGGAASVQMEDGTWRLATSKERLLTTPVESARTVHDLMQLSFAKNAARPACGTRKYLGTHRPEGAKFPLQKFGETQWINYRELGERVKDFGIGLLELGLQPAPAGVDLQTTDGPHCLLIFEETCADWATACMGAFTQSIAAATSYATLGISSVAQSVNETNARVIVCNHKDVDKVTSYCQDKCPSLEAVIYTENNAIVLTKPKPEGRLKVLSMQDVMALGKANSAKGFHPPEPNSVAVIMYTSGSTGKPKGVVIEHRSLVASMAAIGTKFNELGLREGEETYLAYLPAAHILELVAELTMFSLGSAVGFADPKTISSKGACREMPDGTLNLKPTYPHPPGAIQEFQPTVMAAVPKIWDILKKGVEDVVGKGSPVKRFLFQVAFSGRYWAVCQGRESPLFKAVVFKKLSDMLGGRLKCGLSGGGPISADVQDFIRTAFCMPLLQGYALTETCCAGSVQMKDDVRNGVVGPPLGSVEIKLCPCPEVMDRNKKPYLPSDTMHYSMPCAGRGEVLIRGPSVSAGYFKQPDKTAEVFDKDGWFHSGDVGLMTTDGAIMIVDRVKNLVKLKGGEYIALEAMEKEYGTSAYVNGVTGGILCYGDGDIDRPVALVQANTVELEKWAKANGVQYNDVGELCKSKEAEKLVLDSLVAIGKASSLGSNEILCAIALIPGTGPADGTPDATSPWTPENGGLTASNKLNRNPIRDAYMSILEPLRKQATR